MKTRVYRVESPRPDDPAILACAAVLKRGGLVAFPTETVYGLGADALNPAAVRKIFLAKGRPADNPLIVHAKDARLAFRLAAEVPPLARRLARMFWPGPLTMVLPRASHVPLETTAGLDTVAVRVPAHKAALALLEAFGGPVAAPSANLSGRPSPTAAEHVVEDLGGRIDAVLDGGPAGVGLESTVLDLTEEPPRILRPGGVTREALEEAIGPVAGPPALGGAGLPPGQSGTPVGAGEEPGRVEEPVRSPGMKYRHYAPRAEAIAVYGSPAEVAEALCELRRTCGDPSRLGVLASEDTLRLANLSESDPAVYSLGPRADVEEAARRFYDGLRRLDQAGVERIYIEAPPAAGLGAALGDRLFRATEGKRLDAAAWARGRREGGGD